MSGGRPIIIKKIKKGHAAHHGGAWKVAFADFMTAMMAFFLVMWIVGLSESTRRAIAGYFREPGVFDFMKTKGEPLRIDIVENKQHEGDGSGLNGDGKKASDVVDIGPMKQCPRVKSAKAGEQQKMLQLQAEVKRELAKIAGGAKGSHGGKDLKELLGAVQVEITSEGLRIELAETSDFAYFDVGGSRPSKVAEEVLAALAPKLAKLGNSIVIEGHTDTMPFARGARRSNWELSVERANAARALLTEHGVAESQIGSVTGYGDRKLRKPDAPYDVANRRVSMIVQFAMDDAPPAPAAPTGPTAEPIVPPMRPVTGPQTPPPTTTTPTEPKKL